MLCKPGLEKVPVDLMANRYEGQLEGELGRGRKPSPRRSFSARAIRANCVSGLYACKFVDFEDRTVENVSQPPRGRIFCGRHGSAAVSVERWRRSERANSHRTPLRSDEPVGTVGAPRIVPQQKDPL